MTKSGPHPLLDRAVPAAEQLIRQANFGIENLCHELDCGLKDLAEAVPTLDDLVVQVNNRFMQTFIARGKASEAEAGDDLEAVKSLCSAWYAYTLEHSNQTRFLLQHAWAPGYVRPDWYLATVESCFALIETRLARLAPKAPQARIVGLARGLYAAACGLYFLTVNERATPAGIADQHQLLRHLVGVAVTGLQAETGSGPG